MVKKLRKVKIHKNIKKRKYNRKKHLIANIIATTISIKLLLILILSIIFFQFHRKFASINRIHIAISLDNHYRYACIVYLTSLLDNRKGSSFYIIHILINNSTTINSINKINKIKEKFGNNSVKFIYYNIEDNFNGATTKYFPISAYYRLSLSSLLPDIDKIIYTDVDAIIFEDLSEVYNIQFKDKMYFCGVLDYGVMIEEIKKFGIKINKYFNSGFLLMNLKAIRNDGIEKKLKDFISTHFLPMADQTAINAVCNDNIQILSPKYSIFANDMINKLIMLNNQQDPLYKFNESEIQRAFREPTFFHYYSGHKPWKKNYRQFNRVYWWYYAKMSGFYQEILEHYGFSINEIESLLEKIPKDGGLLRRNYKNLTKYKY